MPEYLEPYERAAREHGPTFRATLWRSPEKQRIRFEVIASMIDLGGQRICDAGSGLGDFASFLLQRRVRYGAYVGLEGVAELAARARERGLKRAEFRDVDFIADAAAFDGVFGGEPADVIVFSGSLNTLDQAAALRALERAWRATAGALVFNFLSTRRGPGGCEAARQDPTDPARRFDPIVLLDWAMSRTPSVQFRQDYFEGHDGTVCMVKQALGTGH